MGGGRPILQGSLSYNHGDDCDDIILVEYMYCQKTTVKQGNQGTWFNTLQQVKLHAFCDLISTIQSGFSVLSGGEKKQIVYVLWASG